MSEASVLLLLVRSNNSSHHGISGRRGRTRDPDRFMPFDGISPCMGLAESAHRPPPTTAGQAVKPPQLPDDLLEVHFDIEAYCRAIIVCLYLSVNSLTHGNHQQSTLSTGQTKTLATATATGSSEFSHHLEDKPKKRPPPSSTRTSTPWSLAGTVLDFLCLLSFSKESQQQPTSP